MGRAIAFNRDEALQKALFLFWEKGYEKCSMQDLLQAMDILNGSFYHTFGSKRAVFIEALKFYNADFAHKRETLFKQEISFKQKIRIMFTHVFDRQQASVCPKGCFLFNSVSSEILEDVEIFRLVRRLVDDFQAFLEAEIKQAVANQELAEHIDPQATAGLLIAYTQGMMKLSVLDYADSQFRRQTEYFFTALGI